MRSTVFVISISALLTWMPCPAKSEIVFDNITGVTQFGGGVIADPGYQLGVTISLSGTSRNVTRLDVLLYEFGFGVPGDLTFRVNLWDMASVPGSLIWASPVQHALLANRTPTLYSVDVPGVHVPDSVGWAIESISNAHSAGVVGTFPATVGAEVGRFTITPDLRWIDVNRGQTYIGFRVIAVPEPVASGLVLIAAAALFCRRSR